MKITFEQLRDALIASGVVYQEDRKIFNGYIENYDLTHHLHQAAEHINASTTPAQEAAIK